MTRFIHARWFVAILAALTIGCSQRPLGPDSQTLGIASRAQQVDLLAMGDWGTGTARQRAVAGALESYVASSDVQFDGILLAGDNFYPRQLSGVNDPLWRTMFEEMYNPHTLDFPFYAAFGNHDYENDKDAVQLEYAEMNPDSRWKLPSRWYRIDFAKDEPMLTVFMLDSNQHLMRRAQWHQQNQWLRDQLRTENLGRWVIACAHHPMFSNGSHGDNGVLQRMWGSLFEEHGVDLYLCGHDHDLQHLEMDGWNMSFVLCGGGGAGVRPMRNDRRGPFSRSIHGFAHLTFTPSTIAVRYIDIDGNLVHMFERDKSGQVRILEGGERDAAQPRTIREITRPLPEVPATDSE